MKKEEERQEEEEKEGRSKRTPERDRLSGGRYASNKSLNEKQYLPYHTTASNFPLHIRASYCSHYLVSYWIPRHTKQPRP